MPDKLDTLRREAGNLHNRLDVNLTTKRAVDWAIAEIERLRKIEDAVELWTKGTSEGARKLIEAWNANPRPGKEG